jgi:hypothetical protein
MMKAIWQFFCPHRWRPTKFQALVPGPITVECIGCGKRRKAYLALPRRNGHE